MKGIRRLFRGVDERTVFWVFGAIVVCSLGTSVGLRYLQGQLVLWELVDSIALSVTTEAVGAVLVFWLIGVLLERSRHLDSLIVRMRSTDNATALNAVAELREEGWLEDGSLKGARLNEAILQGAELDWANLQDAFLWRAILQDSRLRSANLRGAIFYRAILREARMFNADLEGADLTRAELQGADLTGANLQAADLSDAQFDATTTMPDGSPFNADTDRFTDPDHADFWRSDDPRSPAYSGNDDEDTDTTHDDD